MIGDSIVRNFVGLSMDQMKHTVMSGPGKKSSVGYAIVQHCPFQDG